MKRLAEPRVDGFVKSHAESRCAQGLNARAELGVHKETREVAVGEKHLSFDGLRSTDVEMEWMCRVQRAQLGYEENVAVRLGPSRIATRERFFDCELSCAAIS